MGEAEAGAFGSLTLEAARRRGGGRRAVLVL